jgi:hypothetical protein
MFSQDIHSPFELLTTLFCYSRSTMDTDIYENGFPHRSMLQEMKRWSRKIYEMIIARLTATLNKNLFCSKILLERPKETCLLRMSLEPTVTKFASSIDPLEANLFRCSP